jgi:nitrite reductase (NADH) small subunit
MTEPDAASTGPTAPTERTGWTRVCRAAEVPVTTPLGVVLRGEDETGRVCVVQTADGPLAMLDRCPHRDIRLSGGVVRDGLLTCPGHFWRFDLTDGHRTDEPAQVLSLYPTRTDDDGWVWARLPASARRLSMREWLLEQARRPRP